MVIYIYIYIYIYFCFCFCFCVFVDASNTYYMTIVIGLLLFKSLKILLDAIFTMYSCFLLFGRDLFFYIVFIVASFFLLDIFLFPFFPSSYLYLFIAIYLYFCFHFFFSVSLFIYTLISFYDSLPIFLYLFIRFVCFLLLVSAFSQLFLFHLFTCRFSLSFFFLFLSWLHGFLISSL